MSYHASILLHIAVGSVAIAFYWVALTAVKGSPRHRLWGKAFFVTLCAAAITVGPLLFLNPRPFDPAHVVQFLYLAACVFTVATLGWNAIRWKHDLARFRGLHFRISGAVLLVLGAVVLAAGVANGSALTVSFSWVGLAYGSGMLAFAFMKAEPHPRWWMSWHLNAVCGLFNAAHGTVLAVAWRALVEPAAGEGVSAVMQVLTLAIAIALRLWFGRKYRAPLKFWRSQQPEAAIAV